MKKHQTILLFVGLLCGFGRLDAKAWSADDKVCVKHTIVPGYPMLARQARITGTVNLDVDVAADGSVSSAVGSGAHNLLDRAAEENVRQWTFCSARESFKLKISYIYRLEGRQEYQLSPAKIFIHLPRVEIVAHPPETQI